MDGTSVIADIFFVQPSYLFREYLWLFRRVKAAGALSWPFQFSTEVSKECSLIYTLLIKIWVSVF
jgi:hypothetical protein